MRKIPFLGRVSKTKIVAAILAICLSANLTVHAQKYQPTQENLESRKEFQDDKFGIFLHWGLYSMLASGEWTMAQKNLNYKEYAKLAEGFYPSKFDAAKWVSAIKASVQSTSASPPAITTAFRCSIQSIPITTSLTQLRSSAIF